MTSWCPYKLHRGHPSSLLLVYLPTCVCLTIGYYVFRRHQAHFHFHGFEIVFCYYHETQWRHLSSLGWNFVPLSACRRSWTSYRGFFSKWYDAYDDWVASDCNVMTWLLSSMHEEVNTNVMFLKTVKDMGYFEGHVFKQIEYFSCCWTVWEVILTATGWSFCIWLLLWVEEDSRWIGFL